jgi:hypothetical protein
MYRFWRIRARSRLGIAVVAAYAVAFQMMLVGVVAARTAAAESSFVDGRFVVCSARAGGLADRDPSGLPTAPETSCLLCTMAANGPVLLPAAADPDVVSATDVVPVALVAADVCPHWYSPRQSRGPPANI